MFALSHHGCFLVVLSAVALFQRLLVDHFDGLWGPSYFVFRKFNSTDRRGLQWLGPELVLINLVSEALHLKETLDPLLLLHSGAEVDLATTLD